jgi:radical SAM superfamily enzyme YgiQ (UPF0313 family)
MDRGVKIEQVQNAVRMSRERGIQSGMFLMWGYEGEELEDIEATVKHVSTSQPDIFFTTVSYPIKGTPYYKRIADRLVQLEPWGKTSDRELTIKGRHTKRFYAYADAWRDEVTGAAITGHAYKRFENLTILEQSIQESRRIAFHLSRGKRDDRCDPSTVRGTASLDGFNTIRFYLLAHRSSAARCFGVARAVVHFCRVVSNQLRTGEMPRE